MMCLQELPTLLDVITLGLSSGLSFEASLDLYCMHYNGVLAELFQRQLLQYRLGVISRRAALQDIADDLHIDALTRFTSTVIQALECGSPLVGVLSDQAQSIRDAQRFELEEEIEKIPVKMLIPMGVLIVPAMLISIMGPLLASTV